MSVPPPITDAVTPADVAALLRARTKDAEGREVGLFTEATRPTVGQVEALIALAGQMLASRVGVITEEGSCFGGYLASQRLLAAMWVELSYFPEQVRTDRSPYEELRLLFESQMQSLANCLDGNLPGGGGDAVAGARVYSIPTNPPWPWQRPWSCEELIANWNPPDVDVDG